MPNAPRSYPNNEKAFFAQIDFKTGARVGLRFHLRGKQIQTGSVQVARSCNRGHKSTRNTKRGGLLRSSTGVSEGSKMNGTKILGVQKQEKKA